MKKYKLVIWMIPVVVILYLVISFLRRQEEAGDGSLSPFTALLHSL